MQSVGAAWLMTSLTPSPLWISLVQSAASLPIFLLALPAGALADIVPRRQLLLVSNFILIVAVSGLAFCTITSHTSPLILLIFTFAVGIGEALAGPAFQAIVSELVPKSELVAAVSLNSVGFNLARAVGPALGGVVLARWGAGATFLVNAFSFLAVLVVLWRWHELPKKTVLPAERFIGAIRAGSRYLRYSSELQVVAIRTGAFVLSASALWALLPVVVREAGRGPSDYGILLGALGVGALIGGGFLPAVRKYASLDMMVSGATLAFGIATLISAFIPPFPVLILLMLLGGIGWMTLVSSLNVATRTVVPTWVQARAIAVYLLVLQGGIAIGSIAWGIVATHFGLRVALAGAGIVLLLTVPLALRFSLKGGQGLDLDIVAAWPDPQLTPDLQQETSPVLVTVEYQIAADRLQDFRLEMEQLETSRRRNGALQWGLFTDPRTPGTYLEEFLVESWLEHQRQHERVTVSDAQLQERILALHTGAQNPRVVHFFAEER
jgi:MFS family permease